MQKRKGETALKPNFLIFVTDQHRADWLSCMGNDILQTPPYLIKIAHRGVLFEIHIVIRLYVCLPEQPCGQVCPPVSTVHEPMVLTWIINIQVLPQILQDNGYENNIRRKDTSKSLAYVKGKGKQKYH